MSEPSSSSPASRAASTTPTELPLAGKRSWWFFILELLLIGLLLACSQALWFNVTSTTTFSFFGPPSPTTSKYTESGGAVLSWRILAALAFFAALAIPLRKRMSAYRAAALVLARAFPVLLAAAMLSDFPGINIFGSTHYEPLPGYQAGLAALMALVLIQLIHLALLLVRIVPHLLRHPPWRHRNAWLVAPVIVGLLLAGGAVLATLGLADSLPFTQLLRDVRATGAFLASLAMGTFAALLALAALAIWQRWSWSAILLAGLTAPVWVIFAIFAIFDFDRTSYEAWLVLGGLVLCGLLAIFSLAAAYLFSPHRRQRRVCWQCGRKRWLSAGQCEVCGELYWIHKDHPAAPLCLACGHESPNPPPVCGDCGRNHT